MSYWVAVVTRNGAEHIRETLDSLLQQSMKPLRVVVVNDGSTDDTSSLLSTYAKQSQGLLQVVSLPDKGYDIRRVPRNINAAWEAAEISGQESEFFMISGDDCTYPRDYVKTLISRMNSDPHVVVTSGRPSVGHLIFREHSPSGSGRLVKCSFWRGVGSAYPLKAGWETWLLCKAGEKGLKVALVQELKFRHVRPRGARHQFAYWGAAMHGLGYLPMYALGRILKNSVGGAVPLKGGVNMVRGYLIACLGSSDPFIAPFEQSLREFVRKEQVARIQRIVLSLFRSIFPT